MSLFTQMIQLQMQILLMLGIGFFLRKKEIVTVEIRKGLSALLINVVLPCTVILSFMNDSIVNLDFINDLFIGCCNICNYSDSIYHC